MVFFVGFGFGFGGGGGGGWFGFLLAFFFFPLSCGLFPTLSLNHSGKEFHSSSA